MLLGVAVSTPLCGCIAIPYGDSELVPDLTSRLPPDLLQRSDEVLVLTETASHTSEKPETKSVIDAFFLKAYQLKSMNQRLTLKSNQMLGVATWGYGIDIPLSNTSLDRICVLARDGREITLTFRSGKDENRPLDLNRREAIVSALRGGDPQPLDKVDGPCGVTGEVHWNSDLRASVVQYLAGLPVAPDSRRSALGRLLSGDAPDTADLPRKRKTLMLLAGTSYYGSKSAEPPVFLSSKEFDEVSAAVRASSAADIVRLLPSFASGERALGQIYLRRFCVASQDGHVLRWDDKSGAWDAFDASAAWAPEELKMMREDRSGPACVPSGSRVWAADERERVGAFLNGVRPAGRQAAAIAETELSALLVGPEHALRATHLLIVIDSFDPGMPHIIPLFLEDGDDAGIIRVLKAVPPEDFAGRITPDNAGPAGAAKGFRPDSMCLISTAGTLFQFYVTGVGWKAESGWRVSDPTDSERAPGKWRDEALQAMKSDDTDFGTVGICWLGARKEWTQDKRAAVVHFLERLPDEMKAAH